MKEYSFKYGKGEVTLNIPESNVIAELAGKSQAPAENIKNELIHSLNNPVKSNLLKNMICKDDKITLVISDMTRFWMRQDLVIPHLIEYLNDCGIKDEDIIILIANGTHLPAPCDEIQTLVTPEIAKRIKVVNHECESEDLIYVGKTTRGTELEVNPLVVNQKTICLGAAAHHLMAGFGGGRKSILPGVASKKSINQNHIHALSPDEPSSNPLIGNSKLVGNPLNEDMCEAAEIVNPLYMINIAINPDGKLCKIISGHWLHSWLECCEFIDNMYQVEIEKKADIVIASCGGFPKDISMYQSTKVVDNVETAVKEGGTIVLLTECIDGGGPDEYFGWSKYIKSGDLDKKLRENFNIPGYVFFQNCEMAKKYNLVLLSKIPQQLLEPLNIKTFSKVESLMEYLDIKDEEIYIIKKGGTVIPKVKEKKTMVSKRYNKTEKTAMGEVFEYLNKYDDIINLSIGDPDIITDKTVIDLMAEDARNGHTKYTDYRGYPELRQEIGEFYKKEYDVDINDNEIFVTAGGCVSMYLVLEAILDDGDEVIIPDPFFVPYPSQVKLARGIPIMLPTYEEEDFQINIQRLESLVTSKTKAIILNNPNNPTGACFNKATLNKIADFCEKYDIIVIADDIYTAFSFDEEFIPIMKLENMKNRTITINSFSKNFVMTGFRVANIIAPSEIIETIQKINENVVFTTPSTSQRAAIYALRLREKIQPPIVEEFKKRVKYCEARINKMKNISVLPNGGSFYVFPNIKKTGLTSEQICKIIMEEAHILVLPGNAFGNCGEGHFRISCTVGIGKLEEAFNRMEKMNLFS